MPALVERACRINIAVRAVTQQIFARQLIFALDYEDFIADHQTQSARLCNFLSVDPRGWPELPKKVEDSIDTEINRLKNLSILNPYHGKN